jgi:hypothetical protein
MPNEHRIDSLERTIASLVALRQRLRSEGAPAPDLEHNRREIVACQQELSAALIATYAPNAGFAAA